ncbi:hypothetical protein OOK58_53250 [Streptomyces sp. NBC_01728]|nr:MULTISPECIES: hypothetical protein [unclassified Streptomyces]MCX4460815.1 hypothetical protein [Streptomyces sp. NBC_01719]MCX4499855.1 hypothetical protein [Streptomyces sp. NBC_01728]
MAFHVDDKDLTYGELDAQANALASALVRAGKDRNPGEGRAR